MDESFKERIGVDINQFGDSTKAMDLNAVQS